MKAATQIVPGPRPAGSTGGRHRERIRPAAAHPELAALALNVHQLSRGGVRRITAHGPVLSARPVPRRTRDGTFVPVLSVRDRLVVAALSLCWVVSLAVFWWWWFAPAHRAGGAGLVANSIVLVYLTCYPVFFVIAANRLRAVSRSLERPGLRLAFVVTKAPTKPAPPVITARTRPPQEYSRFPQ